MTTVGGTSAIFLSASVPDPRRNEVYHRTANVMAIRSAVTALATVALGRRVIIWGGHPSITPIIKIVAESYGRDYAKWVRLYQSKFFEAEFPADNKAFRNVVQTPKRPTLNESLKVMRTRMLSNAFGAAVFIGGMEGVEDEHNMLGAAQPNCRIVPVASTGGAARLIFSRGHFDPALATDLAYVSLFREQLQIEDD